MEEGRRGGGGEVGELAGVRYGRGGGGRGSLRIARREWESGHNNWMEDDQWALLFYALRMGGGGVITAIWVYFDK